MKRLGWCVLLLWSTAATAQTSQSGTLSGDITDATGAVLRAASVTLVSQDREVTRTTLADAEGHFFFPITPIGRYTVVVKLAGFETATRRDNLVEAGKTTHVAVTLEIATIRETTRVEGEVPIVDPTTHTQQTRLRAAEFQLLPYGRSYQMLIGQTPGLLYNTDGNPNTHGALRSNNIFMFDGVNTTDPTAGTVGNSLDYEAIQEVVVRTSALSVEFGRGSGAIVDVITKSGVNRVQGSFKYLATNDAWNAPNQTQSEVPAADGSFPSLARTRFDRVNPVTSVTLGGPVMLKWLWFFAAYERAETTSPERQTNPAPGFAPENYQQTTVAPYFTVRLTAQLAPSHQVWGKVMESPTRGFINDYWGGAAERAALTAQNQGGLGWTVQYAGVLRSNLAAELMAASADSRIDVVPFERSALSGGAPYQDQVDGRFYNGATVDGYVRRPRSQMTGALTYWMNARHEIKAGFDWLATRSENAFRFPSSSMFLVAGFNPESRTFAPLARLDFDDAPSVSTGRTLAFFVRDKMQVGKRVNFEAGIRGERQRAQSDVGATTVSTFTMSPRVSFSAALTDDGRHILVGSAGRLYDAILLGFSDAFAAVPQQTNYNLYMWDGSSYVFDSRFELGASTFQPNAAITPRHMDELTIGTEHRVGHDAGVAVRYVDRRWGGFIEDVLAFAADGSIARSVENVDGARRSYRGLEVSVDRRFSHQWMASASYTWSRTRGNHFGDDFTSLGDFTDATCQQAVDPGLGDAGGRFPCRDVQTALAGAPLYDRPHLVKFNGLFVTRAAGIDLSAGVVGNLASKTTFTKSRTVNVLQPGSDVASGQTLTYYYAPLGSDRVPGLATTIDAGVEGTMRLRRARAGLRLDVFNLFNAEEKIGVNNTAWCQSTSTATCASIVDTYGTATTRGSFQAPRTLRVTFVVRWD